LSTPERSRGATRGPVRLRRLPRRLLLLLLAAAAAPAAAAEPRPLWEFGLGAGLLSLPHYRGSDQRHTWVLPIPYFVYRGEIFKADREGARAVLVDAERFDFDISVAATAPTRSENNLARQGMPDLKPAFEIGPNLNVLLGRGEGWRAQLRLPVRAAFTFESNPRSIGWLSTANLAVDWRAGGWNVGVIGGPVFADRRYHGVYYDVDPAFATLTRPAYRASGGAGGWRLVTGASRRVGNWWLGAFAAADTVRGARFEASPLVRQRETYAAGIAFSYVFAASSRMVSSED
jgi:MipA family protein